MSIVFLLSEFNMIHNLILLFLRLFLLCVFVYYCRGVILYALTVGRLPFNDANLKILLTQISRPLDLPTRLSRGTHKIEPNFSSIPLTFLSS